MASLRTLVERNFGKVPQLVLYVILEWLVIILIFIDGVVSFACKEIARLYELRVPCLLCTRVDHTLRHFYYNDSVCDSHKMYISSLAYCHVHKKLSDIRTMCKGCLLSFAATDKESDSDKYKSLVGFVNKDADWFVDDVDRKSTKKADSSSTLRCKCCGDHIKTNSASTSKFKSISMPEELAVEDNNNNNNHPDSSEDVNVGNRFFSGVPSSESSPRWASRVGTKKSTPSEKLDIEEGSSDVDIVARLKTQVNMDGNTLMALYMELDEERNASAIAANNAMAMITRLQAEKAAVQMEALQYQRMMEEQAEYDQEAIQVMKEIIFKHEEDIKGLESELDAYRDKYGQIKRIGSETCEIDDEDYQDDMKSDQGISSDGGSSSGEVEHVYDRPMEEGVGSLEEPSFDFEKERSYLLGLLRNLEENIVPDSDERPVSPVVVDNESEGIEVTGSENKGILTREVSLIRERLRVIEADSGFLKHAAMTLQRGDEGAKLLTEIAQLLRRLRPSTDKSPSEDYLPDS